ncbi:hypothetical protein ACKUB1_08955 [Methanospirillum stamsii]|uniref:Uncharacterized protein n=1 Tax=Methanospirillum stamsii TaxID=1277351 RepID=A0A2V2N9R1_9EURY|nr:hypothetical protein [Methanospirillum stamsii]PWR75470.1 hypothetical protein DLD82_04910 [Methanospirillum stamsii]
MMKRTTMGIVGIGIIAVLVILIMTLPVSGAGKTGPQDGTGYHFGLNNQSNAGQQGADGSCIREVCPHNENPPRDGTGMQYGRLEGKSGNGGKSGQHGHGKGHHQ